MTKRFKIYSITYPYKEISTTFGVTVNANQNTPINIINIPLINLIEIEHISFQTKEDAEKYIEGAIIEHGKQFVILEVYCLY